MDIVEFVEKFGGVSLYDYQKKILRYIEEHPDVKFFPIPRGQSNLRIVPFLFWHELYKEYKKSEVKND